jgi:hypothetical protein
MGGDNPPGFMGRTFGLTYVASVPDLLLSKPWPRQPDFCPYSISQEVGSLSEKSRPAVVVCFLGEIAWFCRRPVDLAQ